jgi:hypothetical protein
MSAPRAVQEVATELYGSGHVGSVQAFGALLALKLYGLAFVERLIAALLYSGKMNENIFAT